MIGLRKKEKKGKMSFMVAHLFRWTKKNPIKRKKKNTHTKNRTEFTQFNPTPPPLTPHKLSISGNTADNYLSEVAIVATKMIMLLMMMMTIMLITNDHDDDDE